MNILTKVFTNHKKAATIGLISAAVVLSTGVGVACKGYIDNQAKIKQQAVENQKKMESDKIAKQAAEDEAKKKAAAEEAAKLAAASQPAPEAAPAPTTTTTKPATSTATTTKPKTSEPTKTETKPSYETVSVSVNAAGVATIGTSKPGTCYFEFKQYDANGTKINYASASAAASGGTCAAAVPAGTWSKIYVTYKASDYSAKGYGYYMF